MSREIKFRAWCLTKKKMYTGFTLESIYSGYDEIQVTCDNDMYFNEWKNKIIMQFTGLEDKHGKEIFEGDIIYVDWGAEKNDPVLAYIKNPFVIEFRFYAWFPFDRCLPGPENIEINGNIYENPELLEKMNA